MTDVMKVQQHPNEDVVRVYMQGSCFAGSIRLMLTQYGGIKFKPASNIEEADMILYTGGSDVSPSLYNQILQKGTYCDPAQDMSDKACYKKALSLNKFQVGICRGLQFLNVMNGGQLWQDVTNHAGRNHLVQDCLSNKTFMASSLHHQQCILPKDAVLLAYASEAEEKRTPTMYWRKTTRGKDSTDVEAAWYPKSKSLGVQWHPELGPQECVEWFFHYIEQYRDKKSEKFEPEVKVA